MCHHEPAIAEFERATLLNPNLTNFRFAFALAFAGEPARAIQSVESHCRTLFRGRRIWSHSRFWSAAAYAQLGQLGRAKVEVLETLRIEPWFAISQVNFVRLCKHPEDTEHLKDDLRKAGFPE